MTLKLRPLIWTFMASERTTAMRKKLQIYFVFVSYLSLLSFCSNFSSEASQATMYGPPSLSEAADAAAAAAAGSAVPPPSSSSSSSSPPSSSASAFCPVNPSSRHIVERQPRMLNFRVEYRQRSVELVLEEGSTVGEHHTLTQMYCVELRTECFTLPFSQKVKFSLHWFSLSIYRRNQTNP